MNGWAGARGLTLVELLVALLLGAVLSSGLVTAYLGAKRQYLFDDQMARLQENGRFALRLLSRELAMAGFYGGLADPAGLAAQPVSGDCTAGNWALATTQPLDLVDDHAGSGIPTGVGGAAYTCMDGSSLRPGTDLLAVKRTFSEPSLQWGSPAPDLTTGSVLTWYLRLLDGGSPQWQQIEPRDLTGPAFADARLGLWEASVKVFHIRRYASQPGDDLPALCAKTLAGDAMAARCLVEGVEDMQFEFGIDTDGDGVANVYRHLPGPGDLPRAVAVRIHLLLRSPVALPGHRDRRSYALGSRIVPAAQDGYLRRVFSTSVPLHNLVAAAAWRVTP